MSLSLKDLINEALKMPAQDRASIAEELISSLDTHVDANVEAAWQTEVQKRIHDIQNNKIKTISWEEVQKKLKAKVIEKS